jgi:lambda family phage portal protein
MGIFQSAITSLKAGAMSLAGYSGTRDAARHDQAETAGWNPGIRFPGPQRSGEWETITGRARHLDENNGWINGGIDRRVESVIGVNVRLNAQPAYRLLKRDYDWRMNWSADVQARFDLWANDIEHRNDAQGQLTFGAQVRLAYLQYVRDGEACAEIRDRDGLPNTTNVLLIEPERISTPDYLGALEGVEVRNGIRIEEDGRAVGAYVRSGHPNDPNPTLRNQRWDYVPFRGPTGRAKFVHVFSPRRAQQNRGISKLAEAMVPAKMLDRYDRAEVNAAIRSAIYSLFIRSPGTTDDVAAALAPGSNDAAANSWIEPYMQLRKDNPISISDMNVFQLLPGEEVETPERGSPNSNYPEFTRIILQKIAGSLGVSFPQISQDWAGINYSSARALLNEMWRSYLEDRRFFTQHFLTPIYAAWLEMEVANGDVKVPGGPVNFYRMKTAICRCDWIGPGRGTVDPKKEADANNLDTAAGRKSTVQIIQEDTGRDPDDVMAEESWFQKEREARGLGQPNHNVKADDAAAEDGGEGSGTEDDRDGDGVPNEGQKRRKQDEVAA